MVIKSLMFKKFIFIFAFVLAVIPGLSVQVAAQSAAQGAAQPPAQGATQLKQRFSWSGGQNALRYEVVFERIEGGVNTTALREFTANHYIEVILPPGNYRFRVIPYDVLDRPTSATEWRNFEIMRVPEIEPVHDLTGPEYIAESAPKPEIIPEPVVEKAAEEKPLPQVEIAAAKKEIPEEWMEFQEEEEEEQEIIAVINSYEVVDYPMTWKRARRYARKSGGYLAVITSPEEQEYVKDLIIDGEFDYYWLGGQRHPKRIKWRWVNGEKFYYNNWGPGQPVLDINQLRREKLDDSIDIDRLTMFRYSDTSDSFADLETGHWVNNHINHSHPFIIEYPNPDLLPKWKRFDVLKKYIIGFGTPVLAALPVYGKEFSSETININFGVRLNALFLTGRNFYLGPEVSFLVNISDEDLFSVGANLVGMIWLRNEKTAFSFRAGTTYYINSNYFSINTGISFHWRFLNKMSIELGVDYSHSIRESGIGYIRPLFGIGFLF